ncbi:hypothetical protein EPI10_006053 [Gossypium australe]|uniref:Uncharacterized protein n=1 Tax=Gossypium australe TaxID=47621 RepID=A0A5B6WSY5_9ROSI|nr:hypothetical protein EPI10_006053 [Gossypium australe]
MLLGLDQAERVLKIPLTFSRLPEIVVRRYEGSSAYSIKSGLKVLFKDELHSMGVYPYDTTRIAKFYKKMNLAKRKLPVEGVCPLCKKAKETAEHLVRS